MASFTDKLDLDNFDRLGPMEVKELWQGLRRGLFVGPFIIIQILAIGATAIELLQNTKIEFSEYSGLLNVFLLFNSGPFWLVVGLICGVLMPLGGIMLMPPELEDGNHELLQMTHLSRWSVVRGKWLALWTLCLLTYSSLIPYLIVRYFLGGMDVWRNISLALTVVALSGIMSAISIGASSYKTILGRILMFCLLTFSCLLSGSVALGFCASFTKGCGILYHINAVFAIFCFIALGLSLGRSRIRLKVHQFEVKPSQMITGLIIFTPFITGVATGVTLAHLGGIGLGLMGFIAVKSDVTPKPSSQSWTPSTAEGGALLTTPNFPPPPPQQKTPTPPV